MTEPKKFSRGQDEWPDGDGDYRIVCADGRVGWICTAEFGDRTREVAEAVLDVLNGDAVVLPKLIQPEERPEPPKVERVPWWEALRELRTVVDADGDTFVAAKAHHDEYSVLALWDEWSEAGVQVEGTYCPDGMVPVLVEAGEAAER